jgi:hypothetical protein
LEEGLSISRANEEICPSRSIITEGIPFKTNSSIMLLPKIVFSEEISPHKNIWWDNSLVGR